MHSIMYQELMVHALAHGDLLPILSGPVADLARVVVGVTVLLVNSVSLGRLLSNGSSIVVMTIFWLIFRNAPLFLNSPAYPGAEKTVITDLSGENGNSKPFIAS